VTPAYDATEAFDGVGTTVRGGEGSAEVVAIERLDRRSLSR
jgi:hypothetical protein